MALWLLLILITKVTATAMNACQLKNDMTFAYLCSLGHLGHVCVCVCFRGGRGGWVIVIFSVRGDRANLICSAHHCLQSTANKADSYPFEDRACLCVWARQLFVCSALWLTGMIGFCCSVRITIQHAPISTTLPHKLSSLRPSWCPQSQKQKRSFM